MRILHVTTFLQGGAGRLITALALAQRRAGHDVVLALDSGGEPGYDTYPDYREALVSGGVRLLSLTSTFKRDLALNTRAARELRDGLDAWCADVAHAHAAIPTMVARLALGTQATPVIQTMHGWGIAKNAQHSCTDVALLSLADAVVTPSEAARRTLLDLGVRHAPLTVIPYGIASSTNGQQTLGQIQSPILAPIDNSDRGLFEALRSGGALVALCIGTIGARKNQRLLVEAMAAGRLSRLHAVFIGDGDADALRAEAHAHGVHDRVHVLGYRRDASRYLGWSDLFVLPSRNEGLPVALLEAFLHAVPVVASAIPEIAEAVEDRRTGYLFEEGSSAALEAALAEALDASPNDVEAMRTRMREVVDARYTLDRMVTAYERVYEHVIHAR
jgi:glycosyltransferase involved in cell wall biosynthesis